VNRLEDGRLKPFGQTRVKPKGTLRLVVRRVGLEPTPPFGLLVLSQASLPFLYQRVILEHSRWCFGRDSNAH
jgi:hypothetical protein